MTIRKKTDDVRINERIRSSSVRLISAEGEQLGILSIRDAIQVAKDGGLDLVEVAPNSDPPVCRVVRLVHGAGVFLRDHTIYSQACVSCLPAA